MKNDEVNNDVTEDVTVNDIKLDENTILSAEQEIAALRKVHEFLKEFDRVPGSMSGVWSQMLDTVAVVANSLIGKITKPTDEMSLNDEDIKSN